VREPTSLPLRRGNDQGASLVLAVVFVFIMGMVIIALGGLAVGSMRTTVNLRAARTTSEDAEAAVMLSAQLLRYSPCLGAPGQACTTIPVPYSAGPLVPCVPPGTVVPSSDPGTSTVNPTNVYCAQTTNPLSARTRVVDFYACPAGVGAGGCTGPAVVLHAEVTYDDLDAQGISLCYTASAPAPPMTSSCGGSMAIDVWDLAQADS
jgi:hypothetical protein